MTPLGALAVLCAGTAAGTVNTIVGSGSLITFPTLIALGYSPVTANVSNTVGLVTGSVSGAIGYRRELTGQRQRLVTLGVFALAGGLTGGLLLLAVPDAFDAIVPVLILMACTLMAIQRPLMRWLAATGREMRPGVKLPVAVYLTGIYGGYFGAAQGVLLLTFLSLFLQDDLQRLNATKNVLTALVNGVAAVLFALVADVEWSVAVLLAVGATIGGQIGAATGRRIPSDVLRAVVVIGGVIIAIILIIT